MRKLALAALLLTLTACGAATPAGNDSTGAASPSAAASAAPASSAAAQPSMAPSESATSIGTIGGGDMAGGDDVERQALAALQSQFNVNTASLTLQNKEQVEWSDGSLGCPAPDMMYAQVITPGYKLTYSDGSQSYELHTNESGSQVVWCENGKPKTP